MVRGRMKVWIAALAIMAVSISAGVALAASLQQRLLASDGAPNDALGNSVAVAGDTAVVGAPGDDSGRGAAYVFSRSGDTWAQSARLTASDRSAGDSFGNSVAIDGETIVVGAPGFDTGANDVGALFTFARTGAAARTETATLTASDAGSGDSLGWSVAIDGDTIVGGAYFDDNGGAILDQGSVYTFATTGAAARTQTAKLTATDGSEDDNLGASVAIDGDTIVAGATGNLVGVNASQGTVYTFARTGGNRTQTANLAASDGATADQLGRSVAIDGDTIVGGTQNDDGNKGAVYTFARTGASPRTETAKLTASDGLAGDLLGASVAIEGATIAAGAFSDDVGSNPNQGTVYTFARTGAAARTETGTLNASDGDDNDSFGVSVAVSGSEIVAGASGDTVGSNAAQGSATAFYEPAPPPTTTTPTTPTSDTTPPVLDLSAKHKQDAGKSIVVKAQCSEDCSLELGGTVKPKGERKEKLKPKTAQLKAGVSETLKVKLGKAKKPLKEAGKGKAKLTGTATDAAGNATTEKASVTLK